MKKEIRLDGLQDPSIPDLPLSETLGAQSEMRHRDI